MRLVDQVVVEVGEMTSDSENEKPTSKEPVYLQKLEQVLLHGKSTRQQAMDDKCLRSITNPTPWFSLLCIIQVVRRGVPLIICWAQRIIRAVVMRTTVMFQAPHHRRCHKLSLIYCSIWGKRISN